jgi:uncharacterized membrane protein
MSNPSTTEFLEGLEFFPIALVISATVCPGLTLCIPGLILMAVFVIIPILALVLVGAFIAAPFLLVRAIRGLRRRHSADRSRAPASSTARWPVLGVPPGASESGN